MAITISQDYKRVSEGNKWRILGNAALDSSYPAAGYLLDPLKFGLQRIDSAQFQSQGAFLMEYDSGYLKVYGRTSINSTIEPLTALAATFFWVNLGVGLFSLGETITGGTSGATATVAFPNTDNQDDLGVTGIVGAFELGETITGGTSGATANLASAPFSVYEPTSAVACFSGASLPIGTPLSPSAGFIINPLLSVTYDTLVGTFQVGEQVVGGTSANSMFLLSRVLAGKLDGLQVIWTAGAGFTLGETITGSISGATAVVTSCSFPYQVVYRAPSTQWANGRFAVFSPINMSAVSIIVSYVGSNGFSSDEVAIGTNLSALTSVEFEVTGV